MQIDYICLPRVFLRIATHVWFARIQEEGSYLPALSMNPKGDHWSQPEGCGTVVDRMPAMTPSEAIQRRPSRAYSPFSHFEVEAITPTQGSSVQNRTLSKAKAYGKVPGLAVLNPF
jgi:hypothetical protein